MPVPAPSSPEAAPPASPARRRLGTAVLIAIALAVVVLLSLWPVPQAQAQTRGELRIGFQKSASLFALQKSQGTLEKQLAPLGFSVKWVEFPAGPQPLEGLNVGAVDVVQLSLQRHPFKVKPITPAVAADQQRIADTFFDLRPIPKPIQVSEAAYLGQS